MNLTLIKNLNVHSDTFRNLILDSFKKEYEVELFFESGSSLENSTFFIVLEHGTEEKRQEEMKGFILGYVRGTIHQLERIRARNASL